MPALLLRRSLLRGPLPPGLLLILLRSLLTPTATRGGLTLRLLTLTGLLTPTAALLRRLTLRRLTLRGLTLRWLALRLLRALTPTATTLLRRLLSPATAWLRLLRRLAALSPLLPAWLAPRLPRTPWSLRRRRHICSF
ncbi:hypothetical protein AB0E69_28215 [Kribbella sp. NPDC026611]|uniref:hypothetical protein n=1 Tax=Kribbella sp. NPDC026611 TaxID=3154911 RepID=UPI0034086870